MTLKIHGAEFSACTQRVLVTLAEKNVDDYRVVQVDLTKEEHKSPEYLKTLQVRGCPPPTHIEYMVSLCVTLQVFSIGFRFEELRKLVTTYEV